MSFFDFFAGCFGVSLHDSLASLTVFASKDAFVSLFDHGIHGISAVVIAIYCRKSWRMVIGSKRSCIVALRDLAIFVASADGVTLVMYGFFMQVGRAWFPVALGFFITALLLYSLKRLPGESTGELNVSKSLLLGGVQGIALLPGISRMAITYVLARFLKLSHMRAFTFSLLIELPLISAASLRALVKLASVVSMTMEQVVCFASVAVVVGVGAYLLLCMIDYMGQRGSLWYLSYYMIVPLVLSLCLPFFAC